MWRAGSVGLVAVLVVAGTASAKPPKHKPNPANPAVVLTDKGAVRGLIDSGTRSFKGIPYAARPVGNLRWKAPQPAAAWKGVKAALGFGAQLSSARRLLRQVERQRELPVPQRLHPGRGREDGIEAAGAVLDPRRRPDLRRERRLQRDCARQAGRRRRHDQLPARPPSASWRTPRSPPSRRHTRPATTG